ncbi:MAG: hypothetical protein ACWGON_12160 [Gemmatimonadota bacterium]
MTWEERQRYQEGRSRLEELRARLADEPADGPLSRGEALEILDLLESFAERMSPERWDRALEVIADEAARRADHLAARRN